MKPIFPKDEECFYECPYKKCDRESCKFRHVYPSDDKMRKKKYALPPKKYNAPEQELFEKKMRRTVKKQWRRAPVRKQWRRVQRQIPRPPSPQWWRRTPQVAT